MHEQFDAGSKFPKPEILCRSNLVAFACQLITPTAPSVVGNKSLKTEYLKSGEPNVQHTKGQPIRMHSEELEFFRYHHLDLKTLNLM